MFRRRAHTKESASAAERLRLLPWAMMLEVVLVVGQRIARLDERDRSRLVELLRNSAGKPSRLSSREREELAVLISKLDLRGMTGELLPLATGRLRGRG